MSFGFLLVLAVNVAIQNPEVETVAPAVSQLLETTANICTEANFQEGLDYSKQIYCIQTIQNQTGQLNQAQQQDDLEKCIFEQENKLDVQQ